MRECIAFEAISDKRVRDCFVVPPRNDGLKGKRSLVPKGMTELEGMTELKGMTELERDDGTERDDEMFNNWVDIYYGKI